MINKMQKYREERDRNTAKMARLKERNDELDRKIAEAENMEIRALLHSENITLDELVALARSLRESRQPAYPAEEQQDDLAVDADKPIYPVRDDDAEQNENTEDDDDEYDA